MVATAMALLAMSSIEWSYSSSSSQKPKETNPRRVVRQRKPKRAIIKKRGEVKTEEEIG